MTIYDARLNPNFNQVVDKTNLFDNATNAIPENKMFPLSQTEQNGFNTWFPKVSQDLGLSENPNDGNYNYQGFYKASQDPNSGVSTGLNPYDNRIHFSDGYTQNGQFVPLKTPGHPNSWTMFAYPQLEKGNINNDDIELLNQLNANKLDVSRNFGGK